VPPPPPPLPTLLAACRSSLPPPPADSPYVFDTCKCVAEPVPSWLHGGHAHVEGVQYVYVARHLAAASFIRSLLVQRYGGLSCSGQVVHSTNTLDPTPPTTAHSADGPNHPSLETQALSQSLL
jgi:hypothetical protein